MKTFASFSIISLLLLTLITPLCQAALSIGDAIGQLPPCGLQCIIQGLSNSTCTSPADTACSCNNADLTREVEICVTSKCNGTELIRTARVQAELCDRPVRSRKVDIHAAGVLHGVALIMLCLRLYCRFIYMKTSGADDWVALVILPLYIGLLFCGHYVGYLAFGSDIWFVEPDNITDALKVFYIGETIYVMVLGLAKISILSFFTRIFPLSGFRKATYITMGLVAFTTTTLVMLQLLQCIPLDRVWLGWQDVGFLAHRGSSNCIDVNALAYVTAGVSILLDLIILVLPLPIIARLCATRRARAEVMFMFGLGGFILVASSLRLRYIAFFATSSNPTWDATDALIWSGIEVSVAVMCISVPAIRVLARSIWWPEATHPTQVSSYASQSSSRLAQKSLKSSDLGSSLSRSSTRQRSILRSADRRSDHKRGKWGSKGQAEDLQDEFGDEVALGPYARAMDDPVSVGRQPDGSDGNTRIALHK